MHILTIRPRLRKVECAIVALVAGSVLTLGVSGSVFAAGDASLQLTPSSGQYSIGSTLTVYVSESSARSDNMNAVQLELAYPGDLLTYKATDLVGPFTLCAQNSGGNGSVHLACASPSAESGTHTIAAISFTVIATGTAQIATTVGTNVVGTNGNSIWNQSMSSIHYTLAAGIYKQPAVSAPPLGSVSVRVLDGPTRPVPNAVVTLMGVGKPRVQTTMRDGVANISAVQGGSYTVMIDAPHVGTGTQKITLNAGQNKIVSYELSSSTSYAPVIIVAIVILAAACVYTWRRGGLSKAWQKAKLVSK